MKKIMISVAVTAALGLTGCLADGSSAPVTEEEVNAPFVRVQFDPAAGVLPIPSDILLGGTTDGTLNIPVEDADDFSDPQNAINALDGWSTLMPMNFEFSASVDESGNAIDINPGSVTSAGSIRVFKTVMGADQRDEECATAPAGTACRVEAELEFGADFTVVYNGDQATVLPLRPLQPKTGYLVVLTDNITDDLGRGIRPSQTYAVARKTDVELEGQGGQVQGIIQSYEAALSGYGVSTASIAYTSGFTTQSVDDVLQTVKQLMAAGQIEAGNLTAAATGMTAADLLIAAGKLDPSSPAVAVASAATIYGGSVDLPYFSGLPTAESPTAPLSARWQAQFISPASIVTALQQELVEFEDLLPLMQDPTTVDPSNPSTLAGQILFADAEAAESVLAELDKGRHLTKFNPIPAVRDIQEVEHWLSVPDLATVNAVRASMELEAIEEPVNGWPVTIFQHGITGTKENFLPLAGTMALFGQAVISIDHPLHGGRGFGQINASGDDGDPTAYLNLGSLLTARDNLRQSTSDLLGLRFALNDTSMVAANLDANNVTFAGHSLGAIAGTNLLAVANTELTGQLADVYQGTNPFALQAGALGMPGGGIASFLLQSESFGPLIGAQLSFQALPFFQEAVLEEAENLGIAPGSAEFTDLLAEFYGEFFAEAPAQLTAARDSLLTQFRFAAQTVVDSGDPMNYASTVVANETPVYLIQANNETVIPNTTDFPTAGTAPLASALQLPVVTESPVVDGEGGQVSGYVRYENANHSSLLDPTQSAEVTQDMQESIGLYFQSGATVIMVDQELID